MIKARESEERNMTTKEIKEALMKAITNFSIAVKDGEQSDSAYNMGLVNAYMGVLGEFARLDSPWERFWREAFASAYN